MSLYSFVVLLCLIDFIQLKECGISRDNKKFEVHEYDGFYYMFSRDREKFKKAYEVCRNINGYLTDLDAKTATFFKNLVNARKISNENYWIGLLWTPSLNNQVWDSGRRYTDQKMIFQKFFYIRDSYCIVLQVRSGNREWESCDYSFNYICMLDIGGVPKTQNDTINNNTCLLINNALSGTSPPPEEYITDDTDNMTTTIPPELNTTVDDDNMATHIPSLPNTNATSECVNVTDAQETADEGKCDCQKLDQSEAFTSRTKVHLTLGLIMAASVVINIIQGVVNCRNGKNHRHLVTEKLTALAFVDNLNVDNNPMSGPYSENGDAPEREHKQICTNPHQDVYTNEGLPETVYHDIDQAHNETTDDPEYLVVY